MKHDLLSSLEEYLRDVEEKLLNEENLRIVNYPQENVTEWNKTQLDAKNKDLLKSVSGAANVYAIFTSERGKNEFSLRYIGKTKRDLARQRIRNHLIYKNDKTGAKLSEIKAHVKSGGSVKISWVTIDPESLRNYIEEELIIKHKEADWNASHG